MELRLESGSLGPDELKVVIEEVLTELADPSSEAAALAREADLDPTDLTGATVTVDQDQGFFGAELLVGIVSGLAVEAVVRVWDNVIGPRITRKRTANAVGNRKA